MTIKGRKSIPSDEKNKLVARITAMKLEGHSTQSIADELELCWNTVDKYWREVLASAGEIDPIQLLKERIMVTERLLSKTIRSHYAGEAPVKDVISVMEMANKMSGIDAYLTSRTAAVEMPPLLEVRVHHVELEMPTNG